MVSPLKLDYYSSKELLLRNKEIYNKGLEIWPQQSLNMCKVWWVSKKIWYNEA